MKKNTSGLLEIKVDEEQDNDLENGVTSEEKVLLNSIHSDTSSIKKILSGKTDVEVKQLKSTRKVINDSANKQDKNTKKIIKAIKSIPVVNVERKKKDKNNPPNLSIKSPKKVFNTNQVKESETSLNKLTSDVTAIKHDVLNVKNAKSKNNVKYDDVEVKQDNKNTQKIVKAIKSQGVEIANNEKLKVRVSNVKTKKEKSLKVKDNKKSSEIPKSWKKDQKGVYRDDKGRYVSKDLLKKYNATDSRSVLDDEEEKERKTSKILDTLSGIKDTIPDAENVDPMIDATKEVGEAVSTTFGIGKSIFKGLGAVKGFFSKGGDNTTINGEDKSLGWFKRKDKKDKKHEKKKLDLLEEIADKSVGSESGGGGILSWITGGKFLKKFLALAGGGFGLKALFGKGKGGFKGLLKGLFAGGLFKGIFKGGFKGLFSGGLKALFKGGAKRIPILGSLLSFADGGIGGGAGALVGGALGTFFGPIGTVVGSVIGEQVGKWLAGLDWSKVGETISSTWNSAVENFSKLWDGAVDIISKAWDAVIEPLKKVFGVVTETVSNTIGAVKETVTETVDSVTSTVKETVNTVKNTASNVYNNVTETVSNTWDSGVNLVKSTLGFGGNGKDYKNRSKKNIKSFTDEETDAYLESVIANESGGKKDAVNQFGYLGLYQMGAAALTDSGMIKPKAYEAYKKKYGKGFTNGSNAKIHKEFLENPDNWQIKGGQQAFLNDKALQDKAMVNFTNRNYKQLKKKGLLKKVNSKAGVFGALKAAHLKGVGGVEDYLNKGINGRDGNGTSVSKYFKSGIQAYKNLQANPRSNDVIPQNQAPLTSIVKKSIGGNVTLNQTTPLVKQAPKNINVNEDLSKAKKVASTPPAKRENTNNKENNKNTNNPLNNQALTSLLTQDVSERRIAHIVNGGLSKPSQA